MSCPQRDRCGQDIKYKFMSFPWPLLQFNPISNCLKPIYKMTAAYCWEIFLLLLNIDIFKSRFISSTSSNRNDVVQPSLRKQMMTHTNPDVLTQGQFIAMLYNDQWWPAEVTDVTLCDGEQEYQSDQASVSQSARTNSSLWKTTDWANCRKNLPNCTSLWSCSSGSRHAFLWIRSWNSCKSGTS